MKASSGWAARAVAAGALLWSLAAGAQMAPPTVVLTTESRAGTSGDTVVASVVDAGVRTGGRVAVTLRILGARGSVLAEMTGVVSEGSPLRVSARAPDSTAVRVQLLLPPTSERLSAGVVSVERWDPGALDLAAFPTVICPVPTIDPGTGMPEPTTIVGCEVKTRP